MTAGPLSVPKSGWKRGEAAPWWAPGNVRRPMTDNDWRERYRWLRGPLAEEEKRLEFLRFALSRVNEVYFREQHNAD